MDSKIRVEGTPFPKSELSSQRHVKNLTIVRRYFTKVGEDPFDTVEWEIRDAIIKNDKGKIIFEQKGVEVPKSWSQLATNVVASKYFRGQLNTPERERSVKEMIKRVVNTITEWGEKDGYFSSVEEKEVFKSELTYIILYQKATFNSPVWFNVGIDPHPQCSACFINSVEDNMNSILELAATEARLFKGGSGTGTNFSTLRSSKEPLSGGGMASGPVSFMKGFDAFAGVIKSGGKTRRAAKMVILNVDHPDIMEFIWCKAKEEKKAWALIEAGYDGSVDGEAYQSIFFQNSNNSVRVTDEFMKAVEEDKEWYTKAVTTGKIMDKYRARDIMRAIAEAAYICGDPGIQFDTTINRWNTCPNSGRINASNPCSEYMFLDDSACNLASINLMAFLNESGEFDLESYIQTIDIMITAQDIIVHNAKYPTEKIARNSLLFRPLGLGFTNLGALLMARGLPYDSEAGRMFAAGLSAILTGEAYRQSGRLASLLGAFPEFEKNKEPMINVLKMHRNHLFQLKVELVSPIVYYKAKEIWDEVIELAENYGMRNAQVTAIAPTGTISFMLDCDTTGIEPELSLVKFKKLVGGGIVKLVNNTVRIALRRLNYTDTELKEILEYIERNNTIEGAPSLKEEHLPVFDCALKPINGNRYILPMGHLKMMAAIQPFISGAISKTVNLPNNTTVEEIEEIFMSAWKMGLKSIAIYRDGSKRVQPLVTGDTKKKEEYRVPLRKKLPQERNSITHKFSIAGHEGYITVGMYEDGSPGEIFIKMAKEGSTISGLMDAFALATSLALQYGVPLQILVDKYTNTRFEPSGYTSNPQIRVATSIIDYIFKWLALKFLNKPSQQPERVQNLSPYTEEDSSQMNLPGISLNNQETKLYRIQDDAPICIECGSIMVRNGSCYKCLVCGSTTGCS